MQPPAPVLRPSGGSGLPVGPLVLQLAVDLDDPAARAPAGSVESLDVGLAPTLELLDDRLGLPAGGPALDGHASAAVDGPGGGRRNQQARADQAGQDTGCQQSSHLSLPQAGWAARWRSATSSAISPMIRLISKSFGV